MVIMTKDGATLFETIPRTVTLHAAAGLRGRARPAMPSISTACRSPAGTGGNTNASRQDRRPDPAARRRRRHHAEPARRDRARPDHRLCRDRRLRRSAAGARRPVHLVRRARAFPPPARWSTALPARSALNAAYGFRAPAAIRRCCATAAPTAPAMSHNTGGGASYADLLISYREQLDQPMAFDPAAGDRHHAERLRLFSTNAISWFEGVRKDASTAAEAKEALAHAHGGGAVQRRPASTSTRKCRCCSISSTPTRPRRG